MKVCRLYRGWEGDAVVSAESGDLKYISPKGASIDGAAFGLSFWAVSRKHIC